MKEFRKQARLMGSDFEFIIVAEADNGLLDECVGEVKRIETLLTEFSASSQTALINKAAGVHSVAVDHEVFQLIMRSKKISSLTQGSFDITSGTLKKMYNFKGEPSMWPVHSAVREKLGLTGFEKIKLTKPGHVFLETPGMHIAFGAIGKGYAADCVKKLLRQRGVYNGVVNASGDLTAWGKRADGSAWRVGIADPNHSANMLAWLPVENGSVATSGDYEQFVMHRGVRYAHTIDPKTGRPVSGIKSVSVFSASAELSDALATAVFVMGTKAGLHLIEQLPGIHCLIVSDRNTVYTSKHLILNRYEKTAA